MRSKDNRTQSSHGGLKFWWNCFLPKWAEVQSRKGAHSNGCSFKGEWALAVQRAESLGSETSQGRDLVIQESSSQRKTKFPASVSLQAEASGSNLMAA